MPLLQKLLKELNRYVGVKQYSAQHKAIVDAYNRVVPLPVGYKVSYQDDWCDTFVTFIADQIGLSYQIGRECGVERHRQIMQRKGLWLGKVPPKAGDIVMFDWDGGGFCDHIGFVEEVSNGTIKTIEGNVNQQVQRCVHAINSPKIFGYARPAYVSVSILKEIQPMQQIVKEVIRGIWGNGHERIRRLTQAGYDAVQVQKAVNRVLLDS